MGELPVVPCGLIMTVFPHNCDHDRLILVLLSLRKDIKIRELHSQRRINEWYNERLTLATTLHLLNRIALLNRI
jgi:hypothetical protein